MIRHNAVIEIYHNSTSLQIAAADLFITQAQAAINDHGWFAVALSGGSTPQQLYELLASESISERISWQQVRIFWGDERCVPPDDSQSNQRMARVALLDKVPLPAENIFPILVEDSPEKAASNYEMQLRSQFDGELPRFDLILLGLGPDGHTASLFPGTAAVTEQHHWTSPATPQGQTLARVTLTLPVINAAANIIFLVTGETKAAMVHQIIDKPQTQPPLPAQLVKPTTGTVTWLLDKAAGQQLADR
jgi:6-phosphogluconolactonase